MAYRNETKGARAIHLTNGTYVLVEPGATAEIDASRVKRLAPGLVKAKSNLPPVPADLEKKAKTVGADKGAKKPAAGALTDLRREYKAKLGKNPSPAWDADTLKAKIAAA